MKNTHLTCKKSFLASFQEHRLIYQEAPERPGVWSALGKLGDGVGTLANSFANLVDLVTRALSRGVDLVDVGISKLEHGINILAEKLEDPGKPQDLPEYREMPGLFNQPTPTTNEDLDKALMMQVRLIFLKYKAKQYAEFLKPATDQFNVLEGARNTIAERVRKFRPRIKELTGLIEDREITIKSGNLLKTDPRRVELETELAVYNSEKEQLQRASSYEVMWPKPQFQKTEFPPGSGEYVDRLVFDPAQKVKIDLNVLYRWTAVYVSQYKSKFEDYQKEMERLAYHRNRVIQLADKSNAIVWQAAKINFEAQEAQYRTQGATHERNIRFTNQGGPTDVGQLAGAIRGNNAATAVPAPPRPTPTHKIQDDINSLP